MDIYDLYRYKSREDGLLDPDPIVSFGNRLTEREIERIQEEFHIQTERYEKANHVIISEKRKQALHR